MATATRQRSTAQRWNRERKQDYEWRRAKEMLVTSMFLLGLILVMMTIVMEWLSSQ